MTGVEKSAATSKHPQNTRPPSPIDRREGSFLIGEGQPQQIPRTYTYTEHEPGRGITTVKMTMEEYDGLVVTNITKVQRKHPDAVALGNTTTGPVDDSDSDSDSDFGEIPSPNSLIPFNADRYYVVFRGTTVGIFGRNEEALGYVEGVSGAKHHSYKTWNEALLEYSRAYHHKKAGWELQVLSGPLRIEDEDPAIVAGLKFMSSKGSK
ncbi:hypothetical protein VNI00_014892 [Paramarasmius palmivorus]|uniref:Ribonuclease H1 N-terminal domain-containing protein n=1 Tax=Paramarasmius palmivorus TaxID=297713 RepID=A0AAW0BPV5_9AGAR